MWPRAISTASNTTPTNPYNCIGYEAVQVGPIVNFPGESAKLPCAPLFFTLAFHIKLEYRNAVILLSITLTFRRRDGGWYHLFMIFAVFDP